MVVLSICKVILKSVVCILLRVLGQVQPEDGHKTKTCSGY
jgi:hypothetical protein